METAAIFFNWLSSVHKAILNAPWGTLLAAGIGTFIGAYAAFRLEHRARQRQEQGQKATEGNLALLTLMEMYDVLGGYRSNVMEALPVDEPKPWLSLRITYPLTFQRLAFDAARLHFLLECNEPNVLKDLLLEGRRFELAVEMIETHKRLTQDKLHPLFERAGIHHGTPVTEGQLDALLGHKLSTEMQEATKAIFIAVPKSMEGIKRMHAVLRQQLRLLLPGERFLQAEFEESRPRDNASKGKRHFHRVESGSRPADTS